MVLVKQLAILTWILSGVPFSRKIKGLTYKDINVVYFEGYFCEIERNLQNIFFGGELNNNIEFFVNLMDYGKV